MVEMQIIWFSTGRHTGGGGCGGGLAVGGGCRKRNRDFICDLSKLDADSFTSTCIGHLTHSH